MRYFLIPFLTVVIFLSSCVSSRKSMTVDKTKSDSVSTHVENKKEQAKATETKRDSASEQALIISEDALDKITTVDTFSNDGKIVKRTTTKERSSKKKTEEKKTQSTSTQEKQIEVKQETTVSDKTEVHSTSIVKNKKKDVTKFLVGIPGLLLLLLIIYCVYQYCKQQFPSKFYPF